MLHLRNWNLKEKKDGHWSEVEWRVVRLGGEVARAALTERGKREEATASDASAVLSAFFSMLRPLMT
jgi:hypothetical protein